LIHKNRKKFDICNNSYRGNKQLFAVNNIKKKHKLLDGLFAKNKILFRHT